MRAALFLFCIFCGVMAFKLAPVPVHADKDLSFSNVDKTEGIYIFAYSKPANQYDVIGSFDVKQKWSGEPKEQFATALAKLHKDFPGADGIIFGANMQKAEAIKFR